MTWTPGAPVQLETERFLVRSLGPDDANERYLAWLNDPEVMKYTNARFEVHDLGGLREFVMRHDNRARFLLGIFERDEGLHVGNYAAHVHPHHEHCHLGVLIGDRAWWGQGTVLETRARVLDFLFDEAGVRKVCGQCYAANRAALFNYNAQNFVVEGTLRSHARLGDGWTDAVLFATTRDAWHATRNESR